MANGNILWYNAPAKAWTQSLPIGNGTLGGMIYGGTSKEVVSLNHDELWNGRPKNTVKEGAPEAFKKARDLALDGKLHEAQKEIETNFQSVWSQAYMPVGDLVITFDKKGRSKNYIRKLDLENATSTVEFTSGGVKYFREYFASFPAKTIAAKFTCEGGKMNFNVGLTAKLKSNSYVDGNTVILDGECHGFLNRLVVHLRKSFLGVIAAGSRPFDAHSLDNASALKRLLLFSRSREIPLLYGCLNDLVGIEIVDNASVLRGVECRGIAVWHKVHLREHASGQIMLLIRLGAR
jgi:hypothetical protein